MNYFPSQLKITERQVLNSLSLVTSHGGTDSAFKVIALSQLPRVRVSGSFGAGRANSRYSNDGTRASIRCKTRKVHPEKPTPRTAEQSRYLDKVTSALELKLSRVFGFSGENRVGNPISPGF
jgi:hypothetical protein